MTERLDVLFNQALAAAVDKGFIVERPNGRITITPAGRVELMRLLAKYPSAAALFRIGEDGK